MQSPPAVCTSLSPISPDHHRFVASWPASPPIAPTPKPNPICSLPPWACNNCLAILVPSTAPCAIPFITVFKWHAITITICHSSTSCHHAAHQSSCPRAPLHILKWMTSSLSQAGNWCVFLKQPSPRMPHHRQSSLATNRPPFDLIKDRTGSALLSDPTARQMDHLSMLLSSIPSARALPPWTAHCGEHPSSLTPKTGSPCYHHALTTLPMAPRCRQVRARGATAKTRLGQADPLFRHGLLA
jgi:hypothetical protein